MRRLVIPILLVGLLGAATTGCATRNGSLSEFCKVLPTTAAVSTLSPELLAATDVRATMAKLDQISRDLRRLEQVAPRKVRNDVATVANFAQRFSHELRDVSEARSGDDFRGQYRTYDGDRASAITVTGPDGIQDGQPWQTEQNQWYSNPVFIAFQNVSRSYPGALSATSDFVSYAQDRCGEDAVPQGYQPDSGNDPGGFMDGRGIYQPMPRNPVVVQPPPQPGTQPAATTTTTTVPASTPAPPSP